MDIAQEMLTTASPDIQIKTQSFQRKRPEEPRPKKARQVRWNLKVSLTVFFDCNDAVHHEFLSKGCTINKEYWFEVMRRLRKVIHQKWTELYKSQSWIWHRDNAFFNFGQKQNRKHTSTTVFRSFYPAAFSFLIPKPKIPMIGKRLSTVEELKEKSKQQLLATPKRVSQKSSEDWKKCCHKYIMLLWRGYINK